MLVKLDWEQVQVCSPVPVKPGGCAWITFESIEACLRERHLEDVSSPQTPDSHHAARIAMLVTLLRDDVELDPIHVHVADKVRIHDGNHRLRAHQYVGRVKAIRARLTGEFDGMRGSYEQLEVGR